METCKIRRLGSLGTISSAAACPARLFTNQSITLFFPFVITQVSSAPVSSVPQFQAEEGGEEEEEDRGKH